MLARRLSVAPGDGRGGELRSLDMASLCLWDWCGVCYLWESGRLVGESDVVRVQRQRREKW